MEATEIAIDSSQKPRTHKIPRPILVIFIILIVIAIVFGVQAITKTGIFRQSGELIFDTSVTSEEQSAIIDLLSDLELKSDIHFSATSGFENNLPENSILTGVSVAVTDFYDPTTSISNSTIETAELIPIEELTNNQKLLAIDGNYYLDDFNSGALFRSLTVTGDNEEEFQTVLDRLAELTPAVPNSNNVLTLAQTGVTALSRGMKTKLDQVDTATFFTENIGDFLSSFDLTHTSNESSFSQAATSNNICSDPRMVDALTGIGLDIVELTGNHNQDCGDQDALDTLEQYHNLGIQTFGGGENTEAASKPLQISEKGTNITMLGYNYSTSGYTTDDAPGANFYTEAKAVADITAAKERGDFIIADIQFFECNNYVDTNESTICDAADSSEGNQISFFRHLIDLGADIVVGTAAHQPQTFELYGNGAIYYGLGNLFFDQSWWPGTTRSLILIHYFYEGKLLQTRIVPTVYDDTYQTKLMENQDAASFLQSLINVRPAQAN